MKRETAVDMCSESCDLVDRQMNSGYGLLRRSNSIGFVDGVSRWPIETSNLTLQTFTLFKHVWHGGLSIKYEVFGGLFERM